MAAIETGPAGISSVYGGALRNTLTASNIRGFNSSAGPLYLNGSKFPLAGFNDSNPAKQKYRPETVPLLRVTRIYDRGVAMPTNAVALSRLLAAERKSLVRWIARIVGDLAAEDIAQSLFLRVQRVSDDPPIVNKRSFLFRLARNLAVDHVRAERRHRTLFEADMDARHVPSDEPGAEARLLDREKIQILATAIERMPLRCREVFVLIKLNELNVAETAVHLGISQDMVRKHIRHALQICHRSLSDPPA